MPILPNVTLVDRVEDEDLEAFLSAADVWLIPYRKNVAGVSVPSRFYNLLAVGRPVVLVSEPEAEAALIVTENNLGWVVPPGMPDQLGKSDPRLAASSERFIDAPNVSVRSPRAFQSRAGADGLRIADFEGFLRTSQGNSTSAS